MNNKKNNVQAASEILELLREQNTVLTDIISSLPQEPIDEAELTLKIRATFSLSMVRMHNAGEIDLYQIKTLDLLHAVIEQIGVDDNNPIEMHISSKPSRLESARLCLESGDSESALIVVSSFIESEINTAIRIALRLQNFSHGTISDSIKGTDLRTKINVILPSLQVRMSERQRQIALNQNSVRNSILHFKAVPLLEHDKGSSESDYHKVKNQSEDFFERHPLDIIEDCFLSLVDCVVNKQPHFKYAFELFELIDV
jgi:hypothetical protein